MSYPLTPLSVTYRVISILLLLSFDVVELRTCLHLPRQCRITSSFPTRPSHPRRNDRRPHHGSKADYPLADT